MSDHYDILRDTQYGILGTNLAEVGTDCISRQAATHALRKMQTYKMFSGDDMLLIDQAGAQTELMMLPSAQPEISMEQIKIWLDAWEGYIDKDTIARMKYRVIDIPLVNVREVTT